MGEYVDVDDGYGQTISVCAVKISTGDSNLQREDGAGLFTWRNGWVNYLQEVLGAYFVAELLKQPISIPGYRLRIVFLDLLARDETMPRFLPTNWWEDAEGLEDNDAYETLHVFKARESRRIEAEQTFIDKIVNSDEELMAELQDNSRLRVAQLRDKCKGNELPVGGKKAVLIARLRTHAILTRMDDLKEEAAAATAASCAAHAAHEAALHVATVGLVKMHESHAASSAATAAAGFALSCVQQIQAVILGQILARTAQVAAEGYKHSKLAAAAADTAHRSRKAHDRTKAKLVKLLPKSEQIALCIKDWDDAYACPSDVAYDQAWEDVKHLLKYGYAAAKKQLVLYTRREPTTALGQKKYREALFRFAESRPFFANRYPVHADSISETLRADKRRQEALQRLQPRQGPAASPKRARLRRRSARHSK